MPCSRTWRSYARIRERSGAKVLLALKCFATWSVFDLMREYMDGTTSSSLFEVRLGREKFGGETHAYSVAYAEDDIDDVVACADRSSSTRCRSSGATRRAPRPYRGGCA